jgi:hypothetical protein
MMSTAGVDFKSKTVKIDGKNIKLALWDTVRSHCFLVTCFVAAIDYSMCVYFFIYKQAGQERFSTVTNGIALLLHSRRGLCCV